MKHPIYTALGLMTCAFLATSNARGWSFWQNSANRSAFSNTAYRYRPSVFSSSSGGGGWSFGSSHK
ncbi:hypothetical protein [Prosthecobacter dejongeii]|uniref:Uncharacterized protein n=1 Tax=Prosthecobacter dejongeii TaxID=48465 RepID=A0A7W8DPM1_9BACT|nr:hypothetical protein [Prosthecobacter dejongeii]MBB5037295.1 hypothetical protein [Prosthecobacter dejongeii]